MKLSNQPHHIVIVGGGAGGLILATRLAKRAKREKHITATLVDESLTHIWKPLLHEIAAGSLNSYEDELSYLTHAAHHHYDFQLGCFQRLDRNNKRIYLDKVKDANGQTLIESRSIAYDTLVFSVGSTNNDFGVPGVKENCFMLDNRRNAEYFHTHFLGRLLAAHAEKTKKEVVHLNIVGAGATGVELAGEIHSAMQRIVALGMSEFNRDRIQINIFEAGPNILAGQTVEVQNGAMQELKKLGVNVRLNAQVKKVTEDTLIIDEDTVVPSSLCVWAAGIKGSLEPSSLDGLMLNKLGQIVTRPSLQTKDDDSIYAIGDCAACVIDGKPLAPRAQVAHQQAIFLVNNIMAAIQGQAIRDFVFREKGSLITIGDSDAVGNIFASVLGSFYIRGLIAKWAYVSLYRQHQVQTLGLYRTIIQIIKDSLTRVLGPKIKLH